MENPERYYKLSDLLSAFKSESSDWLGAWTEQEVVEKLRKMRCYTPIRVGKTEWIKVKFSVYSTYACKNCGYITNMKTKFCPECGFDAR